MPADEFHAPPTWQAAIPECDVTLREGALEVVREYSKPVVQTSSLHPMPPADAAAQDTDADVAAFRDVLDNHAAPSIQLLMS